MAWTLIRTRWTSLFPGWRRTYEYRGKKFIPTEARVFPKLLGTERVNHFETPGRMNLASGC